jgi:hypothetical protein
MVDDLTVIIIRSERDERIRIIGSYSVGTDQ